MLVQSQGMNTVFGNEMNVVFGYKVILKRIF